MEQVPFPDQCVPSTGFQYDVQENIPPCISVVISYPFRARSAKSRAYCNTMYECLSSQCTINKPHYFQKCGRVVLIFECRISGLKSTLNGFCKLILRLPPSLIVLSRGVSNIPCYRFMSRWGNWIWVCLDALRSLPLH